MIIEYLWLDGNLHMRSKKRNVTTTHFGRFDYTTLYVLKNGGIDTKDEELLSCIPEWNYDGSSTYQASCHLSEIMLKPVNYIIHPFIEESLLVLCETYDIEGNPAIGNSRTDASKLFEEERNKELKPWYGIEQEFFFFDKETCLPIGWKGKKDIPQKGEYYCGVNRSSYIEKSIMEELFTRSLKVGLHMSGINQEVSPAQWEYQIGPVEGIQAADEMIFAKFILYEICSRYNVYTAFHPKPIKSDEWNGSGCHINFSNVYTRNEKNMKDYDNIHNTNTDIKEKYGLEAFQDILERMKEDHTNFIQNYCGKNNELRLTGKNETSKLDEFSYSYGGRDVSVRIPYSVKKQGYGYLEDRRPGSCIDYYKTIARYLHYM